MYFVKYFEFTHKWNRKEKIFHMWLSFGGKFLEKDAVDVDQ